MKYAILSSILLAAAIPASAIDFAGTQRTVITETPESSTGLEALYVLYSTEGVTASYTSSQQVKWYRFSNLGGAYAEEIAASRNGNTYTVQLDNRDMGYIVEDGNRQLCYWVVNYADHMLDLRSASVSPEYECDRAYIIVDGSAAEINYYTINGRREELERGIELEYTTLVFDEESFQYKQQTATETKPHLSSNVPVDAPLCDTNFTISGDRFLRHWGLEQHISTGTFTTTAVSAETRATQTSRENDNEQKDGQEGLGGSAPCEVTFEAAVSDAAIFKEWQISRSAEFDIMENTFNELEFTYTFRDQGTTYVRFVANNDAGTCEYVSTTYEIGIGESRLDIPNAFSPDASPGVNDEWKVSYKSLISFECHIFNRWGTKMATLTDPSQGWDGKYGGKFVPAGVYYYVITAEGADGVKYKRSGDINIIKYDSSGTTSETTTEQ